ncbi:MAG: AAA family ATPase [Candidatus Poribacteria bacterium]|nr:AAA family ATPase [Candidatus Poribacteria bacterium]
MRLERIILKSFGCFDRRDFDLSDGVNLIFGPNFSGKSTLVNAIFFTLTGKPIAPKVPLSALTQSGARSGTAGLSFCHQGQSYQLFRATHGEVQLRQKENGRWRILFTGKRSVEADLRKMFHFSYHHLGAATFLREGEIFEFLARQPADRRDILYALLGIDQLMQVRQRFIDGRRIAKREEKRVQEHQRSLRVTTVKSHRDEIERVEAEVKKLEGEYELLSSQGGDGHDATLMAQLNQIHTRLQQQIDTLLQERSQVLSGFDDVGHLRAAIQEIESATAGAKELEGQREEIIRQIGSLTSQIQALTAECEVLRQLINSDHGHCPTCHQPVQQEIVAKIIAEKESTTAAHQQELETQQKSLDEYTTNVNALRELSQRHQRLQSKVKMLKRIEPQLADLQGEFNGVAERLRALQPTPDRITDEASDLAQIAERRHQIKHRIESLRRRLVVLSTEEAVIVHKLEELQRAQQQANQILRTRLSFELACDGVEKTIASLQRTILQPAEEELHYWLKRMNLFQFAQVDLKSQHLLPTLKVEGVERNLMLLSGSEKMILYLCFKAALSKTLGNPGFFVFDDPTLHLDPERKDTMISFIHQLAEVHQVIVTSNDPDMRDRLSDAHLIEMITL